MMDLTCPLYPNKRAPTKLGTAPTLRNVRNILKRIVSQMNSTISGKVYSSKRGDRSLLAQTIERRDPSGGGPHPWTMHQMGWMSYGITMGDDGVEEDVGNDDVDHVTQGLDSLGRGSTDDGGGDGGKCKLEGSLKEREGGPHGEEPFDVIGVISLPEPKQVDSA